MEINVAEVMGTAPETNTSFFKAPKKKYDVEGAFKRMEKLRNVLGKVEMIVEDVKYEDTEESWRNAYDSIYSAFKWAYEEEKAIVSRAECTPSKTF